MTEMPPDILLVSATSGDSRYLGDPEGSRAPDLAYLRQIAQSADMLGYSGVLIPTGRTCEDSWVIASALAPVTQQLKFLVAARPGLVSPTVMARMTATLDRISKRSRVDQHRCRRRSRREWGRWPFPPTISAMKWPQSS